MKVFLLKNIENVGAENEIVKVSDGYADNFLFPRKFAIKITAENEAFYLSKVKTVENRKQVIVSKTSLMAEKIKNLKISIKRKTHDDGKLYASINPAEIVELLAIEGMSIARNQIIIDKAIKERGIYDITIKLTSQLQPKLQLKIVSEKQQ